MRYCRFLLWGIMLLSTVVYATPIDTSDAVKALAPGSMFTQNEPLRFSLKEEVKIPLKWQLLDWQDNELRNGDWPEDGKGELVLEKLPNGYYKLTVTSSQSEFEGFRSFAIVPDPASRHRNPNTFFALATAQTGLANDRPQNTRHPENAYEEVVEVEYRSGVEMVRDHSSWISSETAPGKFNWGKSKLNADLLAQRGIGISNMFENAPKWAKSNFSPLPNDLVATYNYARERARTYKGQVIDYEFWNEPDHSNNKTTSPWDYVSALKAAYLGFKDGDPDVKVAIAGFTTPFVNSSSFAHAIMQNGASDYFDIFNVHSYYPINEYPEIISSINTFLKHYGLENRPVWFSEIGTGGEGSALAENYMKGLKAHSPKQEMMVAEILPKTLIRMQSLGVDRVFFFVLCPYNERNGHKDWGLMRRDYTVKPAVVAYSTLTYELNDAEFLGTIELGKGLSGYLYARLDGTQSLVYWSLSPFDTFGGQPDRKFNNLFERKFALTVTPGKYQGVSIFGTPFEVETASGKLELSAIRFPAILTGISGLKPSVPFHKIAKSSAGDSQYDRTLVFRVEMGDGFDFNRDNVSVKKDNAEFKLQVWNLSNQEKHGTLAISGGSLTGVPKSVVVPPFSKVEFELTFTPKFDEKYRGALRVGGEFDGKPVSELVVPVQVTEKQLTQVRKVEIAGINDPNNFKKRSSGGKFEISFDEPEQAVKFDMDFSAKNEFHWVYPEYTLQLPQDSLDGAIGLSFEVKVVSPQPKYRFNIIAVIGKGNSYTLQADQPTDQWETRTVLFPECLDPSKITKLQLGLYPKSDVVYWIRNFRVIFPN